MSKTKIVCAKCGNQMDVSEAGIYILETPSGALTPKKLWCADLWKCDACGVEVVAGFAQQPMATEHDVQFQQMLENALAGRDSMGRSTLYEFRTNDMDTIEKDSGIHHV